MYVSSDHKDWDLFRHLETVHGVAERSLIKLWTCPRWEVDFPGHKIASHFTSCGQTTPRPSFEREPNTPSVVSLPRGSRVLRSRVNSHTRDGSKDSNKTSYEDKAGGTLNTNHSATGLGVLHNTKPAKCSFDARSPPTMLPPGKMPPAPSPVATASSSSVLLDLIVEEREKVLLVLEMDAPLSPDDQWLYSLVRSGSPHSPQTPNLDVQQGPPPTPAQQHPTPPASGAPERPVSQQETSSGQTPRANAFLVLWA